MKCGVTPMDGLIVWHYPKLYHTTSDLNINSGMPVLRPSNVSKKTKTKPSRNSIVIIITKPANDFKC